MTKWIALAACLAATPSFAQMSGDTFNGCDIAPGEFQEIVAPLLSGGWKVTNGAGVVNMMGIRQPLAPEAAPETMLIAYNEGSGELHVDGEEFGTLTMYPLDLSGLSEEERSLGDVSEVDINMFEETFDCGFTEMPVVAFEGYRMEQGTRVSFHIRYYVVNPDLMVGNMRLSLDGSSDGQAVSMNGYRYLVARANR
ncbi:MAG: hypothetical protein VX874_21115 [Pseudomonadota bacterium]|nr:hypothetical protein [Pseudomonadota bacterium]